MGRKAPPPRPSPREWPPAARTDDPQTSHDGATDAARRRSSQCLRMLEAYLYAGERGCTADEAAEFAGLRDPARNVCYWHRASDLRDKGLIVSFDPARRRLGYAGSAQDVKVITDAGRVALALRSLDVPRQRTAEPT